MANSSEIKIKVLEWLAEFLAANNYAESLSGTLRITLAACSTIAALTGELGAEVADVVMSPSNPRIAMFSANLLLAGRTDYLQRFLTELPESGLRNCPGFDEILAATKAQAVVEEIRAQGWDAGIKLADSLDVANEENDPVPALMSLLKAATTKAKSAAKRVLEQFPLEAYTNALKAFVDTLSATLAPPFLERVVKDIQDGHYVPDHRISLPALRAASGLSNQAWKAVSEASHPDVSRWLSSTGTAQSVGLAVRRFAPAPAPGTPVVSQLKKASEDLKSRGQDPLPDALRRASVAQHSVAQRTQQQPSSFLHRSSLPTSPRARAPPPQDDIEPEDAYGAHDEDETPSSPSRPAPRLASPRVPDVPPLRALPFNNGKAKGKRGFDEEGDGVSAREEISISSTPRDLTHTGVRKRRKWTEEEEMALLEGVRKHGPGYWREILVDSKELFGHRTSVDLKDKYRNIQNRISKPAGGHQQL